MTQPQVVVVGGGLVGLATAYALVQRGVRVCVVEKETVCGLHQSGHTSGVVQSGVYCRPGSLKLRLTLEGSAALERFCAERGIGFRRTGQLVVATNAAELKRLADLARRADANQVSVQPLSLAQVRQREPHLLAVAGLWVEQSGLCDYPGVVTALSEELAARGVEFLMDTRALRVYERSGRAHVLVQDDERTRAVTANQAVVCAGLFADRLYPSRPGSRNGIQIAPFRSEYAELVQPAADLVHGLVHPVPDPASPFVDLEIVRGLDGRVRVASTVVPALSREGYRRRDVNLADLRESMAFAGTWRLARRNLRFALGQATRSVVKPALVHSVRRLLPGVSARDLVSSGSGVRAHAVRDDGTLVDDFEIRRVGPVLHVLNAPSPAATACLALGEHLAQQL